MADAFNQFVNNFTQQPLGLESSKVHQIIAKQLCDKVNKVITDVHDAHHDKRIVDGRPSLPRGNSARSFIDPQVFEANLITAGFDTNSWIKVLRKEAHIHNDAYHDAHSPKVKALQDPSSGVSLKRLTPVFNPKTLPFGNAGAGATEQELALLVDKVTKSEMLLEAFAVEGTELGAGLAGEAALAAGSAAFGPVGVAVAALIILPLIIANFFESAADQLHAEIQLELERHEQELRNLQADREKALEDLAKHDAIVEQINQKSDAQKKRRDQDRKRRDDDEKERKRKRSSYIGCVERIEYLERGMPRPQVVASSTTESLAGSGPLPTVLTDNDGFSGYEIRMSCVAEMQISKPTILAQIQNSPYEKLWQLLPQVGLDIFLCSCFLHEIPADIDVGSTVHLEVSKDELVPSDGSFIVAPYSSFVDGVSMIEKYGATLGFTRSELAHTSVNEHGFNGKVTNISTETPSGLMGVFDEINGGLEKTQNIINFGLDQLMEGSKPLISAMAHSSRSSTTQDSLARAASSIIITQEWTKNDIEIKLNKFVENPRAANITVADIGQGASQVIGAGKGDIFISDFGYGRGPGDVMDRAKEVFSWDLKVPVVLSHWDRDHYGIAASYLARQELEKARVDQVLPWDRVWIVPQLITGVLANQLKRQIKAKGILIEFPLKQTDVKWGNITISNCNAVHTSKVDKNNNGALAFWFGDNATGYTFYPGDANYEAIRIPTDVKKRIAVMIATHHGSMRSIKPAGGPLGSTIPQGAKKAKVFVHTGEGAMTEEFDAPLAIFSYGAGNSYNHNVDIAGPFYKDKGYPHLLATAALNQNKVTDGVSYFIQVLSSEEKINLADIRPSILHTSTAKSPSEARITAPNTDRHFYDELTLSNSNLSTYFIKAQGKIQGYQVLATKLKIVAPLHVPCTEDFSISVLLQCRDIEIQLSDAAPGTLISFDVLPGSDWLAPAEAGCEGRPGQPAAAGGCLDLRVADTWTVRDASGSVLFASTGAGGNFAVVVEYLHGQGGRGQQGGRGERGKDGANGTNDESGGHKGKGAQKGGMGAPGAAGGTGGQPASFAMSRILATRGAVELASAKLTFAIKVDGFGANGAGGRGGEGGPGGLGGIEGLRYHMDGQVDHQNSNRHAAKGPQGITGPDGEAWKPESSEQGNMSSPGVRLCKSTVETQGLLLTPEYWEASSL